MTWHDRKPISFLGTVPTCKDDSGVVERSMKVNGHWVKQNFASYGIVSLYNAYMGGVDVSDRRISSYARLMEVLHSITRFLFYLIKVCISNAHILEIKSPNHTTTTTLAFRKSLIGGTLKCSSHLLLTFDLIKNTFTTLTKAVTKDPLARFTYSM